MGCDIHIWVEVKREDKWIESKARLFKDPWGGEDKLSDAPFNRRSYDTFAFLAGVRNRRDIIPIQDHRGLPEDSEWLNQIYKYAFEKDFYTRKQIPIEERETNLKRIEEDWDYHSKGWLSLKELLEYDYDKEITLQEYKTKNYKTMTDEVLWEEEQTTMREFLGEQFFDDLAQMKILSETEDYSDVRIIFYFDN